MREYSSQDQKPINSGGYHRDNGLPPPETAPNSTPQTLVSHHYHGYNSGASGKAPYDIARYSTSSSNSTAVVEGNNTNASSSTTVRPPGPYTAAVSSSTLKVNASSFQAPSSSKQTNVAAPPNYETLEGPQRWSPGVVLDSSSRPIKVKFASSNSQNPSSVYSPSAYQPREDRAAHHVAAAAVAVARPWGGGGGVPHRPEAPPPPPPPQSQPHPRYGAPYEAPYQVRGGGAAAPPPPPPPPQLQPNQSYSPPVVTTSGHHLHHRHHPVPAYRYPYANRLEGSSTQSQQQVRKEAFNDVDGREGATSPSQIESSHRDEVTNMGCTCKKTKCLKLYCQCFAVKIYCGPNCRCLVCFNTVKHEKQRKEAMRNILSRNPSAFDTKFLKTKEQIAKESQLVLAHKLGCKCRKSACMKKYCECYAGNVKCSASCRCVGCKNQPSGGFGGPGVSESAPTGIAPAIDPGVSEYDMISKSNGGTRNGEPWMMNAAQNLTFLKHGSPSHSRSHSHEVHSEAASMPSLAASSSDTSPDENLAEEMKPSLSPQGGASQGVGGAVNTLLMAAYAMTEIGGRRSCDRSRKSETRSFESPQEVKPSPSSRVAASGIGTPRKYETRKELFRPSPKRKSVEAGAMSPNETSRPKIVSPPGLTDNRSSQFIKQEEENTSTECMQMSSLPGSTLLASTPAMDDRQIKRSRLGSVRKKMSWESSETNPVQTSTGMHETPKTKSESIDKLTPVSARCIDFRRMHVNENGSEIEPS